jgi:hypothetical protein
MTRLFSLGLLALSCLGWAQTDPKFFAAKVYPVFEAAQCGGCHTHAGVASATRLHFPEKDASPAQIQAFGLSLAPLGSLLLAKPTNRVAHTGGERIKPGSDEEKLLTQWVEYLGSLSEQSLASLRDRSTSSASKGGQLVRRLTHNQYNNTVRDLLGDTSRPALRFPSEDYVDGFKNQLRAQGTPPLLIEAYSTTAERLALNAFRAGDINGLVPCKPASATDVKCRNLFVRSFGMRAFRRRLRETEFQRYTAAFDAQARSSGKFLEGARAVVEAMLQSPKFLFHVAPGDYGLASRLSYLLWDTMPDKALFDAAASGELRTVAGRELWARRMLDNPQARAAVDEFFNQWLRFDRVLNAEKERRQYPEFTPELAAAMVEETKHLLQHLVWEDGNFMEAFRADFGFLTSDLASLYKLPAPSGQFELVRFPATAQRAGLLGQGSILASTAGPAETSPTARGIFIREQLLCQHVPLPPPNVNTSLPEPTESKPATRRQLMVAHAENPACASCHKLMDPIGFGLERFDAIGRWRDKEKFNLPVDTKGEIAGLPNSAFSDSKQLGRILAESPVCQECIVRQVFRYAYGRTETADDQQTIQRLFSSFRESGFRFKELLIAVVRNPEFVKGLDHNIKAARR